MGESVNLLLSRLCELLIGSHEPPTVAQPRFTRAHKLRTTRTKSWNVLFSFINGPHRKGRGGRGARTPLTEVDQINAIIFQLRQQRQFDDANRLEEQLDILLKAGVDESMKTVLTFLIHLCDVNNNKVRHVVGYGERRLPLVFPSQTLPRVLPPGPLTYGDTCLTRKDDPYYTHFPSKLFEVPGVSTDDLQHSVYDLPDISIFCMEPGKNLRGRGVFNIKGNLEDVYEKRTRHSLFGALTHSVTSSNDVILDFPDIHDTWDTHLLELKPATEFSHDEGFEDRTPSAEGSLVSSAPCDGEGWQEGWQGEEDLWDLALKHPPCRHHTWELRGRLSQPRESPYVSEAGIAVFDELYLRHDKQLRLLDPTIDEPRLTKVSMYQLVKQTLNMLVGVPSHVYILKQTQFELLPHVYVPGLSPPGLAAILDDVMSCGSQYVKLVSFSQPPVINSLYQAGLVFQAFTGAVRKYLQHYRACILSIPKTKTLLQLGALLEKIQAQMRVLAQLCMVEDGGKDEKKGEFPTGVGLLSYLYDNTLESSATLHYPLLLSLLHTSCGPYIVFLREWVFYGNCRDLYGEFLIQINDDFLRFRDRSYWMHGYEHVAENLEQSVPLFLKDLANEIFVCGKSINLLRLICPDHFMFSMEGELPNMSMTFSEIELSTIQHQVDVYVGRMREIARQRAQNREAMLAEAELAKQAVLVKARATALDQVVKYQKRVEKLKQKIDDKKRAEFAELKEQMEKDLRRRATEREQEREEDAARVAKVTHQEVLEAAVEEEIAQKAREEMIEEYAAMTAQAAARERRALWKVARHRLETRRLEFLTQDEAKWQAELYRHPMIPLMDEAELYQHPMIPLMDEAELYQHPMIPLMDEAELYQHPMIPLMDEDVLDQAVKMVSAAEKEREGEYEREGEGEYEREGEQEREGELSEEPTNIEYSPGSDHQIPSSSDASDGEDLVDTEEADTVFPLPEIDDSQMPSWARGATTGGTTKMEGPDREEPVKEEPGKEEPGKEEPVKEGPGKKWHVSQQTDLSQSRDNRSVIKTSRSVNAMSESKDEIDSIPRRKMVRELNINVESEEIDMIPRRKMGGMKVNVESEERERLTSTRGSINTSQQSSAEVKLVARKKLIPGQHVSRESREDGKTRSVIRINMKHHPSVQSAAVIKETRHRSQYGHPSMMSNYEIIAPLIKATPAPLGFTDADFGCFQIKPRRKKNEDLTDSGVDRRGVDQGEGRRMYATKESEYINVDKLRSDKFRSVNIHGHSSDSSVQKLLYGENFGRGKIVRAESLHERHEDYDVEPWTDIQLEEYDTDFTKLNHLPVVDLMTSMLSGAFSDWSHYGISTSSDISAYSYVSLSALLKRAVVAPLSAQIQLVNQSLVNYYLAELEVEAHFEALRRFLLMQDGEFGQSLSDQLFEKLALCPLPHEIFNPMILNNVLSRALRSSLHGDSPGAANVGFAFQYIPPVLEHNSPKALECLQLTYNVEWPVNIIITMCGLTKYSRVFSFMLQLKRAVWVLKDVWHRLKRDAIIHEASTSCQFRKLQLYRHEMQHFVKVMQGYIANQVIHVTWQEFQDDLTNKTHSIDDLHTNHTNYLNKCINRCLLNKKAGPVMKIIEEIFEVILKFRAHLVSHEWREDPDDGTSHPAYDNMCNTYKVFKEYARFLFKVVSRLALRGYQPHLQELLLRLNYNSYYSDN